MTTTITEATSSDSTPSTDSPDLARLPAALDCPVLYVVANDYIGSEFPYEVTAELGDSDFSRLGGLPDDLGRIGGQRFHCGHAH